METVTNTPPYAVQASDTPGDLPFRLEDYASDLCDLEISEDQKRELLETIWSIMRLFAEFGYSYDVGGRAVIEIFNRAARGDDGSGA